MAAWRSPYCPNTHSRIVVAFVPGKIDVDVRWIFPAGIEKPFKEQMMFDRIDMGDVETVGDDRGRHRASAACARRLPDDFLHDEKIMGEAFLSDDGQFLFDPLADFRRQRAIPFMRAGIGFVFQERQTLPHR